MSPSRIIWIDIKNSHEPLLFKSLMADLPYKFYITARDYAEIISLLKKYGIPYKVVGKYHAKSKAGKILYLGWRSLRLALTVPKFDLFLSHGSIYGILGSKIRRRSAITITDNDFYNSTNRMIYGKSDYMILPKYLKHQRFKTKYVVTFDGFKEDIYIADFNPERCEREIPLEDYVLLRPEAFKAYYLDGSVNTIVPEIIREFSRVGVNIVLLPRYPEEREKYKKYKNVFIPEKPINGLCGAWFARAVLTGSGTLGREAACMGVPAVSFFPGKDILSVDAELIKRGWLYHSRDPRDIVRYVMKSSHRNRSLERSKKVKIEVIKILKEIIGD